MPGHERVCSNAHGPGLLDVPQVAALGLEDREVFRLDLQQRAHQAGVLFGQLLGRPPPQRPAPRRLVRGGDRAPRVTRSHRWAAGAGLLALLLAPIVVTAPAGASGFLLPAPSAEA